MPSEQNTPNLPPSGSFSAPNSNGFIDGNNQSPLKKIGIIVSIIAVAAFLVIGATFPFRDNLFSLIYQRVPGFAWDTDESVQAYCNPLGEIVLEVSFENTEPNQDKYSMDVKATDLQTGKSVDLGTVKAGETKTGQIITGETQLDDGQVRFDLTWSDGRSGTDRRNVAYDALACQAQPTPTPTIPSSECPYITQNDVEKLENLSWDGSRLRVSGQGDAKVTFKEPIYVSKFIGIDWDTTTEDPTVATLNQSPSGSINISQVTESGDSFTEVVDQLITSIDIKPGTHHNEDRQDSTSFSVEVCPEPETTPTPTDVLTPTPTDVITPTPSVTMAPSPTPEDDTHAECRLGLCVEVPGPGADACFNDSECVGVTPSPTPVGNPEPTPTNTPSPTPTMTPSPTPTPTTPPAGAPEPTNTPTPTPTPMLGELPDTGATENTLLVVVASMLLVSGGFVAVRRSR